MRHSKRVAAIAALLLVATGCTRQEIAQWVAWADEAPEAAAVYANRADVQESLIHDTDQDGVIEPDAPPTPTAAITGESVGNRCTGLVDALNAQSPGWDVNRMAAIAYRESRCQPGAANSCCTGLFQIHAIWIPKAAECGVYSRSDLTDPAANICVAAIIYRTQGMGAWS